MFPTVSSPSSDLHDVSYMANWMLSFTHVFVSFYRKTLQCLYAKVEIRNMIFRVLTDPGNCKRHRFVCAFQPCYRFQYTMCTAVLRNPIWHPKIWTRRCRFWHGRDAPGPNLGPDTDYPDWNCSWFYSLTPEKCRNSAWNRPRQPYFKFYPIIVHESSDHGTLYNLTDGIVEVKVVVPALH